MLMERLQGAFFVLLGSVLVLGAGCATATDYELSPSQETPAAAGVISVEEDDNNNLKLTVEIDHVPPPEQLSGELNNYVAWIQPTGSERVVNLGALQIDDERQATLETTTPHDSFTFFVTAETSGRVAVPSDFEILTRQIDHE